MLTSKRLPNFRPLTTDIINNFFQVNSYISDFQDISSQRTDISDNSQDISINELAKTLFSQNSQNYDFEDLISMIPSKLDSEIFNQKDQIIKEMLNKIKKFYQRNNQLIEKGQTNYYNFNGVLPFLKGNIPFYPLIPKDCSINFPLRNDFVISNNVQIATNGNELFLLADHFVFIFKLLIGTELLVNSYKRVDLDPNITDYNQIVCYGQDALVKSSHKCFLITRKMNKEWKVNSFNFPIFENTLICSDGVVLVVIYMDRLNYDVYSLNDGSLIFSQFFKIENSKIKEIFQNQKFLTTNGSILTVIHATDDNYLYYNFSLINGSILNLESRKMYCYTPSLALCIHHDSINNCQWLLNSNQIDKISMVYSIGRIPSFCPYNPFICPDIKRYLVKHDMPYFGLLSFSFRKNRSYAADPLEKIFYGKSLGEFKAEEQNLFLFIFASLFFNPFISHMDQVIEENSKLPYLNEIEKYRIKDDNDKYQKYLQDALSSFIKAFYGNSFGNSPVFSLWILRQYQFSWYSKIHSQKMLNSFISIYKLKNIANYQISSLFLNILSINSISCSIVEFDDKNAVEVEPALFISFLPQFVYFDLDLKNESDPKIKIIWSFLNVVFDLLPLMSYRKRMYVIYFPIFENFGFSSLRSFFDYSLFISMSISCLLVSKNDVKWSYNEDNKKIETNENEEKIETDNKINTDNSMNEINTNTESNKKIEIDNNKEINKKNEINRSAIISDEIKCEKIFDRMQIIYKNWKPLVNKNISEKVQLFDAKCLFVFYKLIAGDSIDSIIDEIQTNIKTNKNLHMSLDLMYYYRNKYRKSMQDKNEKWIEQTEILLKIMNKLKCKFDENDDKKALINEFMQHDYHIAYNFIYNDNDKKNLIENGMKQLINILDKIPDKIQDHSKSELLTILFDLLTRFSKFHQVDKEKELNEQNNEPKEKVNKKALEKQIEKEATVLDNYKKIIKTILNIDNFQYINKFSALYIIRSLEVCNNDELNYTTLEQLLSVYDIEEGVFKEEYANYQNEENHLIYYILILYLVPSIRLNQASFLKKSIIEFNQFQWLLLQRIVNFEINNGDDQSDLILKHLIDDITNVETFMKLGNYRSIALEILSKLNSIKPIQTIDSFFNNIFDKIVDEIESFKDTNDDSSISFYFINEIKKNDDNFIFKKQFNDLINFSDEFTNEKFLCCSLKIISSIDELITNSQFMNKMIIYFSHVLTHKHLSSGYLAMNSINKFLSNQDFCDKFINEIDLDEIFYKLKSNNDQNSIIKRIIHLNSLNEKEEFSSNVFDTIITNNGLYLISPIIKKLCMGSLKLRKSGDCFIEIYICEDSKNSKLFNVVTHSKKSDLDHQTEIDLTVDSISRQIIISKNDSIVFTNTSNPVRLVIFSNEINNTNISIENDQNIFEKIGFIDRQSFGIFNIPKKKSFIDKQKFDSKVSTFSELLQNNLNEKICFQFLYEKRKTLISIKDISFISNNLKFSLVHSYKKYLTETTFFLTAVKMVSFHPEILNYNSDFMLKLFVLLILNYDTFSIELFLKEEFPFKIDNIILKSNFISNYKFDDLSLYTIQSVLQSIIDVSSFKSLFYFHIKSLYRQIYSHFPRKSKIIEFDKQYQKYGFIFIPEFCENCKVNFLMKDSNVSHKLPYFSKNSIFSIQPNQKQFLFYSINPQKRNWIFNSPFEFLVLLKYFIHLSSSRKERELIKSCLFEAVFINSPILSLYSIEFLKFIFLYAPQESENLTEHHFSYQKSLLLYQKYSKSFNVNYQLFLNIEIMAKADPCIDVFYQVFPEFAKNLKSGNDQNELKFVFSDFSIYSHAEELQKQQIMKETDLSYSCKLFNLINFFKIKKNSDFPYFNFFKYWATAQQELMVILREDVNSIDVAKMKRNFFDDVNDFILLWKIEYTKEALISFIKTDFSIQKVPFYIISKTSENLISLLSKFQMSLILTVVLVLYDINHSFQFCDVETASQLVPDFVDYLYPSSTIQMIRNRIVVNTDNSSAPRLYIDRKSVYLNQKGCKSIIEQFAEEIKKVGTFNLQCQKPPFRVTFTNEAAIDASGPMRELLTEISSSIFDKKTNLTITTPSDLSLFIPFTNDFEKNKDVYYAIGVYIGIIIRTNLPQSIPFAPLVWNYLANERISEKDIVSVDNNLNEMFKNVRKSVENHNEIHFPWKATNWNSTEYTIKGKIGQYVSENEVEEFIHLVVEDRINSILNPLIEMRNGLADNLGFRSNMPFGSIFAKMAQSESTFSVEDLMAIAKYTSCSFESKSVKVFWSAVRKLTMDQLSLLLKFITTQTRIPNDSNSNFTINIVEKQPNDATKSDNMLLSASTCFNRLYLPCYSTTDIAYQKIVTSIEFCQTMELS